LKDPKKEVKWDLCKMKVDERWPPGLVYSTTELVEEVIGG
jgi:hypothetical protein